MQQFYDRVTRVGFWPARIKSDRLVLSTISTSVESYRSQFANALDESLMRKNSSAKACHVSSTAQFRSVSISEEPREFGTGSATVWKCRNRTRSKKLFGATASLMKHISYPVLAAAKTKRTSIFASVMAALHHSRRLQAQRIILENQHLITRPGEGFPKREQARWSEDISQPRTVSPSEKASALSVTPRPCGQILTAPLQTDRRKELKL